MKISLNWIKEYVPVSLPANDLAHRLTMQGLHIEEVIRRNPMPGVVIGKVLDVAKHPNADKLSLTRVDIGKEVLTIVCGAPNVKAEQIVPVATVGTVMPSGLEIKTAKIRGEESSGMICSKSELGFEKEKSPGIWELDKDLGYKLGEDFAECMKLGDTIFDIDVTSNRPDCLNYLGVAREIAIAENLSMKIPESTISEFSESIEGRASVTIEDAEGCPRYAARVVLGVKIGPSPPWLVDRLESAGLRSINAIVDVTNFVMLECGQPLHAFDYDQLAGHQIAVKKSKAGESFTTLDGKTHRLNEDTVMICDEEKPIAMGGIMGGKNSEISDTTVNILLESACFDPVRIRRSAKHLGITTDASNRFARGVDPQGTVRALNRAAELIQRTAGGQILAGLIDINHRSGSGKSIALHDSAVEKLLAKNIPRHEITSILERLDCRVTAVSELELRVAPPSFRNDLEIEEDLIEEIARIYGYNDLPASTGAFVHYAMEENKPEKFGKAIRSAFREMGFSEITTNSMVAPKEQLIVVPRPEKLVRLMNPISEEMSVMRLSLLPSMFEVLRGNLYRKNFDMRFYEIGKTYAQSGQPLPEERTVICGCVCGARQPIHWNRRTEPFDFFDLKAVLRTLSEKFMLDSIQFNSYNFQEIFSSGSLEIMIPQGLESSVTLGHFGRIQKNVLRQFDIETEVWAFELDYSAWLEAARFRKPVLPISRFPSIRRDLALTVNRSLQAGTLTDAIRRTGGDYLHALDVFDLYTGDQIAPDKKSLAFSLQFQSADRTLTEEEIDQTMKKIILNVGQEFSAQLRS
jgi:phenylalanyl-tRNA synthetase beta chain